MERVDINILRGKGGWEMESLSSVNLCSVKLWGAVIVEERENEEWGITSNQYHASIYSICYINRILIIMMKLMTAANS